MPGFDNYTETNCYYAIRQKRVNQFLSCHLVTIPYKGAYLSVWISLQGFDFNCVMGIVKVICHRAVLDKCWPLPLEYLSTKSAIKIQRSVRGLVKLFKPQLLWIKIINSKYGFLVECVSECWKETYSFSASYADLQLALNFNFGNWTILPNQRCLM